MPDAVTVYIALGANLGDRAANIAQALRRLGALPGIRVVRSSPLWENAAVGGPPESAPFLNAAAELSTTLSAADLLAKMLAIELDMGRVRLKRWEPRILDLDLLLYGTRVIDEDHLTVPHPRMHERRFVLKPLADIAPEVVHPVLRKTINELLQALP